MEVSWNRATPSHHPFLDGIFPNKNHPANLGYPHDYGNPPLGFIPITINHISIIDQVLNESMNQWINESIIDQVWYHINHRSNIEWINESIIDQVWYHINHRFIPITIHQSSQVFHRRYGWLKPSHGSWDGVRFPPRWRWGGITIIVMIY